VGFSLGRKEYDVLVTRLQKNNRVLTQLTNRSVALEPSRRKRQDSSKLRKIGEYAQSLFLALQSSFGCKCKEKHTAILDLSTDTPYQSTASKQNAIEFHVVLSCAVHRQGNIDERVTIWQESRFQPVEDDTAKPPELRAQESLSPINPCLLPATPQAITRSRSPISWRPKSVRFLSDNTPKTVPPNSNSHIVLTSVMTIASSSNGGRSMSTPPSTMSKVTASAMTLDPTQTHIFLSNMCKVVTNTGMAICQGEQCLGYILNGQRKFLFFSLARSNASDQGWATVSLKSRSFLQDNGPLCFRIPSLCSGL